MTPIRLTFSTGQANACPAICCRTLYICCNITSTTRSFNNDARYREGMSEVNNVDRFIEVEVIQDDAPWYCC